MNLSHSHLPAYLTNSWLWRKLFLVRKLFFTPYKSFYYGQMGEDIALKKFFAKDYKGFFVDVGCYHPKKYNNTYSFYKKGWRGINIDIDSIKIEGFQMLRSKDTNICSAVSDQEGEVTFWSNGFYTPTTTLDQDFTADKQGKKYQYKELKVQARSLNTIIDSTSYKDRHIDLLTIDVEGHDYQVLRSLDFDRYRPTIVAVESQHSSLEEILEEKSFRFLNSKSYELVNWVGMTMIFRRKED